MPLSRREFIKTLGISLAALATARCSVVRLKGQGTPRDRLRQSWLQFGRLAEETRQGSNQFNGEWDDPLGAQLIEEHRKALDDLVTAGDLSAAEADLIHEAYSAAIFHIWRSNIPVTCYNPMWPDFAPTSAGVLVNQAATLAEMAKQSDIAPETVAAIQAAIEHDLAFVALTPDEEKALYEALRKAAGESYQIPPFEEISLDISPEMSAAAKYLVELLLDE
jgi:hypothetical protein